MTFDELLKLVRSPNGPRLCDDSRLVQPGDIFVAVNGPNVDGHRFIPQALANGAKFFVCQSSSSAVMPATPSVIPAKWRLPSLTGAGIQFISVPDSSLALAILAQAANGDPASKLTNLAVTGTNGKTTVTFLVRSCFHAAGEKCGLIGTVIYDTGLGVENAPLTTPDCLTIAQKQSEMLSAGAQSMIIEASSHALDQNRLASINFKAAAFTNLTGDHLDYHKTTENYLAAKSKLFEALSPDSVAILNKQSPYAKQIADSTKAKVLFFAVDEPAGISADIHSIDITGTTFMLHYRNENIHIKTPLLGRYNVANHLAAAGLALAGGLDLKIVAKGLASLDAIPGRLENVKPDAPFTVLVDFAHTDDALKNVLSTLRPLCKARLIVLFGCGGDRDKTKRPRMAKVVEQFADLAIVTSDNPRTEDPDVIVNEVVAGFTDPKSPKIKVEPDRRKAIEFAIESAQKNDVILLAGKGHENYQIIGRQKFPFSDKLIALDCLRNNK
jgi:UDP-N-acetylmuramoyl-L-alanyl-D-glutamate--2,6-diaminopimelate ligase